ncbi:thiol-disulfide oxidoreductase ResA [Geobacter sp. OR-1]|uniref:TlpA family protein disulfide reductase n=1 Tax=Geobacter sp. OR-1 TaxID=1266765 RepID=UPI0005431F7F|nr:TlpA disulfide reductase family protein [Geobacter sp. OR-1]GAM08744.1 thiol-disulfide oxidoreductase ResA [Geobacter sp. OR-1]
MNYSRICGLTVALLVSVAQLALAVPQKGEAAPPFRVTSVSGQQITLNNYRGKVLLMDFFATWCSPCRESVGHLVLLNRKYGKQGLQILGLSLDDDDSVSVVREFINSNKVNYPVAIVGESFKADYALRSVPTLYVISKKGLVAEKFSGYNDEVEKRLDQILQKLLSE